MKRRIAALLVAFVALVAVCWPLLARAQPISFVSTQGTVQPSWCVGGGTGPCLKNNAGIIEARNAALSSFAIVRGATAVSSDDLTSKAYSDGHVVGLSVVGPGGGTLVLTSISGALSWAAPSGGITQITGDATAGPGAGSQALTFATVNGSPGTFGTASAIPSLVVNGKGLVTSIGTNSVSLTNTNLQAGSYTNITGTGTLTAGSLGIGFTLNLSLPTISGTLGAANGGSGTASPTAHDVLLGEGSSAFGLAAPGTSGLPLLSTGATSDPAFGSLSLAGSGITGALPDANQAAQTMTGDVGPNTGANVVNKITAAAAVDINQPAFTWRPGAGAPTFSQTTPTSDVAPTNIVFNPQAPFASATTNKTPASYVVNLSAPISGGTEARFTVNRTGGVSSFLGTFPSFATIGALWVGIATPSSANYSIASDGSTFTNLNSPLTANTVFTFGGAGAHAMTSAGLQVGANAVSLDGGVKVLSLTDATTLPTSVASGHTLIYSSTHQLETNGSAIQFSRLVTSPVFQQAQQTTDVAPGTTLFKAGDAFGSASTNIVGGQGTFSGGAGAAGGIPGPAQLQTGNADTTVVVSHNFGVLGFQGGLTETLVHTNTGFTTQQAKFDEFAKGGTSTMGGTFVTATSAVALASGHSVAVRCHGVATVTTAGTFNAVGDSAEQTVEFLIKNVGGTVTQVGSTTSISKIVDSSYNSTSTAVGWNNSGTTIGCIMLPVVNTAGGSPVATVTVWGEASFN